MVESLSYHYKIVRRRKEVRWSQLYNRNTKSNLPLYFEYSSSCILPINPNSGCDAKSEDHGADSQTTKRFDIRLFSRKLTIILSHFDWILICFHIHMYTYIESLNSTEARLWHTPPTYFVNVVDTAGPRRKGGRGHLPPPQFLADRLPLFQPWRGRLCAPHYYLHLPFGFSDLPPGLHRSKNLNFWRQAQSMHFDAFW